MSANVRGNMWAFSRILSVKFRLVKNIRTTEKTAWLSHNQAVLFFMITHFITQFYFLPERIFSKGAPSAVLAPYGAAVCKMNVLNMNCNIPHSGQPEKGSSYSQKALHLFWYAAEKYKIFISLLKRTRRKRRVFLFAAVEGGFFRANDILLTASGLRLGFWRW